MKNTFISKFRLLSLVLGSAILLTQCEKKVVEQTPENISSGKGFKANALVSTPSVVNIDSVTSDGGYCYVIYRDFGTLGDSSNDPNVSVIRIYENGIELGPAHSKHSNIRNIGEGRFSHWGNSLYFSASDNSDPRTNGRIYTYTIGEPGPIGYANVDGLTTGGEGGATVNVSNITDLQNAANSDSTLIIYVTDTISGSGSISMKSNKSIIGLSGAVLDGVGIKVYYCSNVIIQNLKIQNVVAGLDDNDCINIKYSDHVWVDHCEMSADRTHGWDYWDGLLDITKQSNYITVSWNKFHDSHKCSLVGGGVVGTADVGYLKVTYHHNYFYNISERAPDMKFGFVHMFNNYHVNNTGYSIAALASGTVRTDNNYFSDCNQPITTTYNGIQAGYISGANTNIYSSSGSNNITTSASTWLPPYEYNSLLNAAADVPNVVQNGAGPK